MLRKCGANLFGQDHPHPSKKSHNMFPQLQRERELIHMREVKELHKMLTTKGLHPLPHRGQKELLLHHQEESDHLHLHLAYLLLLPLSQQ